MRESEFVAPAVFREYYEHLTRGYARFVRQAQLDREVDARYDPEVIAYMYTGIGNFIGMRWADWTAGGQVPDDVVDDVLEVLRRGLPPRGDGGELRGTGRPPRFPGNPRAGRTGRFPGSSPTRPAGIRTAPGCAPMTAR